MLEKFRQILTCCRLTATIGTIIAVTTIILASMFQDNWHESLIPTILQVMAELGLENQFFMILDGVAWIVVITVLGLLVIWLIRTIGGRLELPVDEILNRIKNVLIDKLKVTNEKNCAEPFRFCMCGLKIEAKGILGKIIFVSLLGTIATTAGVGFDNIWQFNAVPD
ncbi:MAG: hypothetical protein OXC46_07945, partial [Thaumarchaeota archaeon]|nr:hypothetical protein [Nitrososphaerota archaeon]